MKKFKYFKLDNCFKVSNSKLSEYLCLINFKFQENGKNATNLSVFIRKFKLILLLLLISNSTVRNNFLSVLANGSFLNKVER